MFSTLAFFFKNGFLKLFYRFSSHSIAKLIFLKFYFFENTGSALESFSPFNPTKSPPKRKHFLKITAFPLTKKAKKDFISNPYKNKT
ncbi:hypothetical protein EXS85_01775 [Helicobacter pylori]|nr:hypothetical protein [Helicobacter pylori]